MYIWIWVCIYACLYAYMVQVSIKTFKKEQFIPLVPVVAMEISVGLTQ